MNFNENYNHSSNDVIEACGFNEEYFQAIAQKLFDEFNQDIPSAISAKIEQIERAFNLNPKVMTRFLCMLVGFKFAEEIHKHHVIHMVMGSISEHLEEVAGEMEKEVKIKMKKDATKKH